MYSTRDKGLMIITLVWTSLMAREAENKEKRMRINSKQAFVNKLRIIQVRYTSGLACRGPGFETRSRMGPEVHNTDN